ncbi:MAG: hypothetical protein ACJAVV_003309 [Alphaproteobacteria bacterium]|jgi:hypothetical protein
MKKVLIFALALILAAALIGPKIVGSQLANGIQNTVDSINKSSSYSASVISMESSWFSTRAEVTVGMIMPDMSDVTGEAPVDFSINLDVSASHGPFIINDGLAIGWLHSVVQTQVTELPEGLVFPNNDPLYKFNGLTGLFGATTYQDSIAAMGYTDPETQATLTFTGLTGNGEISGSGVQYKAAANNMSMNVENMLNFNVENIALDVKSPSSIAAMLSQGLYDSNMSFSTQLVTFTDVMKGNEVRVTDTKLIGISDYDKETDLGNVAMTTTVALVDAPNMNLSDLKSVIEIKNLQATFLLAYQDFSSKMLENMSNPTQVQVDLDAFMNTYLLDQLQANPEYNFSEISGKINGSEFRGKIMAKLGEVTELPKALEDTAFWMQNVIINSNMLMQKDAAEFIATTVVTEQLLANPNFTALSEEEQANIISQQVQGTIDGLVQQGMASLEGEDYSMIFTLEGGIATLNGNIIPL